MDVLPIDVVVPAYNSQRYIAEALESVAAQTSPAAEVIVVDDGSADGTADIAEQLGATVIRQANQGVSRARNVGIRAASQPWVAFLDADDCWLPEKLALQWSALQACPKAGFAFGDWEAFDDDRILFPSALQRFPQYLGVQRKSTASFSVCCNGKSLATQHLKKNFIATSTLVVKTELLRAVGLFDPDLKFAEDRDLQMRLMTLTTAAVVEQSVLRYRVHGASASADLVKMWIGRCTVGDKVLTHPERYPSEAPAHYRREQFRLLRKAGVHMMSVGQFADARRILSDSLRRRYAPSTHAAYFAAWVFMLPGGPTLYRMMRAALKALKAAAGKAP